MRRCWARVVGMPLALAVLVAVMTSGQAAAQCWLAGGWDDVPTGPRQAIRIASS